MEKIKIHINGQEILASAGQTILEVVNELGLDTIPTLCHSEELKPYGSCFVCVVELEGKPNLVPSCATKIFPGMRVITRNDRIVASRKTALELLLSNHYADCVSPCLIGCPAHVDAQGYIALAAMGETRKAIDLIRKANPFPSICGRVCVRKCEINCRREEVDEAVAINNIKRYISDAPGAFDGTPVRKADRGKSIGVVGAGPSGLTAAWFLGLEGYDVVLYEEFDRAGGMLRYGIPEYRLPDEVLDKEIDYILRAGGKIEYNCKVGTDISFSELRKTHDAVYLAVGASVGKPMRVPQEHDTEGVVSGVKFLHEKADNKEPVSGTVVVVGGGNTAMDCARTSWRSGADKVILLYRRTKEQMPADKLEIEDCIKEGIEIYELAAPVGIVKADGKLKALKCIRMKLGEPDASGRRRPVPQEGSEFELPCDLALSAIGQSPVLEGLFDSEDSPEATRWNTIVADEKTMKTNIEGVFAGGDAANDGPTVVIDAIADGQKAAKAIHSYLSGEKLLCEPFIVTKEFWSKPGLAELGDIKESPRHHLNELDVCERENSFCEVATGFDYDDMLHEADRCLSCGCVRFDDCALRLYAEEYEVNMETYKGYVRKHKIDDRHPYIIYDPNKCILCARCIRTCDRILPVSALGLINRGFKTEMRPAMNDSLAETSCIACGNCVDSCPTGALTIKNPFRGRASLTVDKAKTHCGFCSVGCELTVKKISNGRYTIAASGKPGDYLCRYGRFGNELFIRSKRPTTPVERVKSELSDVSFEYAYRKTVEGFKQIVDQYGPDKVGVFVSPELTNEEMYLAAKIAREGIGTNNIGNLSLVQTGMKSGAMDNSFGFTASTTNREAVRNADLIIVNNTDTQSDQLILSVEIIDAVKNGAKLIVSNSMYDPLEELASVSLDPLRGRSSILYNGIIQVLLDEDFVSREKVASIDGGNEFLGDPFDYSLANVSMISGVDVRKIRTAADAFMDCKKVVFVHSPDRAYDTAAGDIVALSNFIILLRAAGVEADILLPSLSANTAGVEISGADPAFFPGRIPASSLPGAKDRDELRELLATGEIKAALVIGEDPFRHDRSASWFRNTEFLVNMDWASTETGLFANINFPFSTSLENEGTRCNFEGKLISFKDVIASPFGLPGWKVLAELASKFGINIEKVNIDAITSELKERIKYGTGNYMPCYWNEGEDKKGIGFERLNLVPQTGKPSKIPIPLTVVEAYKRSIHDVGKTFKVN